MKKNKKVNIGLLKKQASDMIVLIESLKTGLTPERVTIVSEAQAKIEKASEDVIYCLTSK